MFEQFKTRFPLDGQKWDDYVSCFKQMKVPAKTVLLKEGDVSKKYFSLKKVVSVYGSTIMGKM